MSVGVALAGGGLKGIAHIGALKALEELGLKIDYISGTSSGSIMAVMYAMGYSTEEMKHLTMEYYQILTNIQKGPIVKAAVSFLLQGEVKIGGIIAGEKIENLIQKFAKEKGINSIQDVKIPIAIPTVDTISTKECIFLSEKKEEMKQYNDIEYIFDVPIAKAVRASMSFPGIFTTCDMPPYNFIDGGTKDNLPTRVLRDFGADKVIGINFKMDDYVPRNNILEILLRTVDIFSLKDIYSGQREADLAIEIDASGTSLLVIDDFDQCVKTGYDEIMRNQEKILELVKEKS